MKIKKNKSHTLTSYDSSAFIDNLHICGGTDVVHALSLGIVHAFYEIKAPIQIGGGASNVMLLGRLSNPLPSHCHLSKKQQQQQIGHFTMTKNPSL